MIKLTLLAFIVFFVFQSGLFAQEPDFKNAKLPTHKRVEDLLKRMTIANWYDNKKAAVSITFDDCLPGQFTDAAPILEANGINGTFFIITKNVDELGVGWLSVINSLAKGHEIGNHTVNHPAKLKSFTEEQITAEFVNANETIFSNTKYLPITMSYTNGDGGGSADGDLKIRNIVKKMFIGARTVGGEFNEYGFADDEENYFLIKSPMITNATTSNEVGTSLDKTIAAGGWYCPTYHGVVNGLIVVSKALFETHIREYTKRNKDLWFATFADIIKYHRERKSAKLVLVSDDNKSMVISISLSDTLSNHALWNQALTINLKNPDNTIYHISQDGKDIPFIKEDNNLIFNVMPDMGTVILNKR